MYLSNEKIAELISAKIYQQKCKKNPKFKGKVDSNRDIAEQVLGNRKAESTVRRVWRAFKRSGHYRGVVGESPVALGSKVHPDVKRKRLTGNKFVITSVQNNTLIHEDFFSSLLKYCEYNDAELLISSFYYNKSGVIYGKKEEAWFDERVKPYLLNESVELAEDLVFCGELNILPTAVNPLSGLDNYTGVKSGIVPHAKLALESLPTPIDVPSKIMYTTGALTQLNYRQEKSGQKGEYHHCFAALVVEIDEEGYWFVRQLNAESDTGCFYDLTEYYTPTGVTTGHNVAAVNLGDLHTEKLRDQIKDLLWRGDNSLIKVLKPENVLIHDVLDFGRRNHHSIKDPYYLFKQYASKKENVKEELGDVAEVLLEICTATENGDVVVVESNHDLALTRWLKEQDYRRDPVNAVFFLELQLRNYKKMAADLPLTTFEDACFILWGTDAPYNIQFLKTDESYVVKGVECGQHGDLGNNGSRGSVLTFRKQGGKFNIGHGHSACIKENVYMAGAAILVGDAGYTKGGSSWNISNIITYPNGKRAIITCTVEKWRA